MSEKKLNIDEVKKIIEYEIRKNFKDINLVVIDRDDDITYGIFFICDNVTYNKKEYREFISKINYEYVIKNNLANIYYIYE